MGAVKKGRRIRGQHEGINVTPGQEYGDDSRDSQVYLDGVVETQPTKKIRLAVCLRTDQEIKRLSIGTYAVPVGAGNELPEGQSVYDDLKAFWPPGLNDKWHAVLIDRANLPPVVNNPAKPFRTNFQVKPRAKYDQKVVWAVAYENVSFATDAIYGETVLPWPLRASSSRKGKGKPPGRRPGRAGSRKESASSTRAKPRR